jgi:transmembrane sensor
MINNRAYILLTRKLTGEANESEINELNLLLDENPEFTQVANQVSIHWGTQQGSDEEFLEATYLLHIERMKTAGVEFNNHETLIDEVSPQLIPKASNWRKTILWSFPLVLLLAVAAWFFTKTKNGPVAGLAKINSGNNLISTRNGSRTKIELPDGSSVWLNAGSKLEYDKSFGNDTRDVYLTGEAYFDVVKNPEKPFIVNTGKAKVKVLGTAFNVRCYPDDKKIETSLIHGSVEVILNNKPEEKWVLKPNHKLVLFYNNKNLGRQLKEEVASNKKAVIEPEISIKRLTYLPGEPNAVETAWTFNILSFEDESFVEAAQKMARWYDVEFVFKKKELENLLLHGTFTIETIHEAMEALQYSFKFRYEIKDKIVTIY